MKRRLLALVLAFGLLLPAGAGAAQELAITECKVAQQRISIQAGKVGYSIFFYCTASGVCMCAVIRP